MTATALDHDGASAAPLVKPVLFQEVGANDRAPSVFFEGRSPHGHNGVQGYVHGGADESAFDPGFAGDDAFAQGDDGGFDSYESDATAFDPIVPAEVLAPPPPPPVLEPEEDPRVIDARIIKCAKAQIPPAGQAWDYRSEAQRRELCEIALACVLKWLSLPPTDEMLGAGEKHRTATVPAIGSFTFDATETYAAMCQEAAREISTTEGQKRD